MSPNKKILWTTKHMLKKAIKSAYLDYYGSNISDMCIKKMLDYLEKLREEDYV